MFLRLTKHLRSCIIRAHAAAVLLTIGTGALLSPVLAEETAPTIGQWMLVGDSISHGTFNCTYRWNLQQVFIDNGVGYDAVGPLKGGYFDGYETASYGGKNFDNEHAAQYNIYGSEISGKELGMGLTSDGWGHVDEPYLVDNGNRNTAMLGSNIKNWLGQDTALTTQRTNYTEDGLKTEDAALVINGTACITYQQAWTADGRGTAPTFKPDTVTIMMGTNDRKNPGFLDLDPRWRDSGDANAAVNASILENVGTVVDSVFEANDKAEVYIMTMPYTNPVVGGGFDRLPLDVSMEYNQALGQWVANNNKENEQQIHLVDVNKGMLDVTMVEKAGPGIGGAADGMMADWTHMSTQGNLVVAGNLAKGMGYAGRTAGLTRQDASEWAKGTYDGNGEKSFSWGEDVNLARGYSVEFNLALGDGSENGWVTDKNVSVSVGDGVHYGTLDINEAFIKWGDTILYSRNAAEKSDNIRIAYVVGEQEMNLAQGYYVWLGDQLIGEALDASWGDKYKDGITISADNGLTNVTMGHLAWNGAGAWAPTAPEGLIADAQGSFKAYTKGECYDRSNTAEGMADFSQANALGLTTSDNDFKRLMSENRTQPPAEGITVHYANFKGDAEAFKGITYTGLDGKSHDVKTDNTIWQFGEGDANGYLAAFGTESREADISVRIFDQSPGFEGVYGLYDHTAAGHTLTGDVLIQLDAKGAVYGNYQGSANVSATGSATLVMNSGRVDHDVVGGFTEAEAGQSLGSTAIYINNDAVVMGSVYGGSMDADGTIKGNALITVTGGKVKGNIIGDSTDSVLGESIVRITGGEIGTTEEGTGNITADKVTVESNKAYIHGDIAATEVTLSNISEGKDDHGFDKYNKTITADKVTLENVRLDDFGATVKAKELHATKGTDAYLSSAANDILSVTVESGSSLLLNQQNNAITTNKLTIGSGSTTGLASGDGVVTVKETLTLLQQTEKDSAAALTGDLVIASGATIDVSAAGGDTGLVVYGSLTLQAGITLSDSVMTALKSMEAGSLYDLFVVEFDLTLPNAPALASEEGGPLFMMLTGVSTAAETDPFRMADASAIFTNFSAGEADLCFSGTQDGGVGQNAGTVYLKLNGKSVPEPATTTLSLLALAGLCARRRRK